MAKSARELFEEAVLLRRRGSPWSPPARLLAVAPLTRPLTSAYRGRRSAPPMIRGVRAH
jgi:hypothetical protein